MAPEHHPTALRPHNTHNSAQQRTAMPSPKASAAAAADDAEPPKRTLLGKIDYAPVKTTEKDVLLGRGSGIAKHPGNVYFRQMVNKHRADYAKQPDTDKHLVGRRVLEEIAKVGGRFLTQDGLLGNSGDTDQWRLVEEEKQLEKACQALRERRVANPPTGSPFSDANKDAGGEKKETKEKPSIRKDKDKTNDEPALPKLLPSPPSVKRNLDVVSDGGGGEPATKKTKRDASDRQAKDPPTTTTTTSTPMERIRSLLEDEMVSRLQEFVKQNGHCAVPPLYGYSTDSVMALTDPDNAFFEDDHEQETGHKDHEKAALADWCIAQRQVYREVVTTEYRKATPNEQACLDRLKTLGFVWDYNEWHYQHMWNQLQKERAANDAKVQARQEEDERDAQTTTTAANADADADADAGDDTEADTVAAAAAPKDPRRRPVSTPLSQDCRAWWLGQREQYHSQNANHWTTARREQLAPLYM